MRIQKILNNNAALTFSESGEEIVVTGKGICFQKKVGDLLQPEHIEKEFILKNNELRGQFESIVAEAPYYCVRISQQIIDRAKLVYGKKLNENIYVSLTDHIYFSIQRVQQGLSLKGTNMLWDIPWMYPEAYKLGEWGRELIEQELEIDFPKEESSFIALHIVTAETNDNLESVIGITKIVPDIVEIIQYHFGLNLPEEDLGYYRLLTHLKFFAQRIMKHSLYDDNPDDTLFESVKEKYAESYVCVEKIVLYIESTYDYPVTQEEKLYLTVHIERLIRSQRKN